MKLYGDTNQEKELGLFVHELNSSTTEINVRLQQISEWLQKHSKECSEKGVKQLTTLYVAVEYIKSNNKRIQDAQDNYYTAFKNDFNKTID